YLRAFLAWEAFLEESFILFLMGMHAPRGRPAFRYSFPPSRRMAEEWCTEGRPYAKWDEGNVIRKAKRFFRNGYPFSPVLEASQHGLERARTIRNAVAHESADVRQKFEGVVRHELGVLPPRTTVGSFLTTPQPGAAPPQSFLESYIKTIETL